MAVKMTIADLAGECFDESIELGEYSESTARIQKRVLMQIRGDSRRRRYTVRRTVSFVLIAAVLVSLLTATAYALGVFQMHKNQTSEGEEIHGQWIERDEQGNISYVQDMRYPDANLSFTYDCETTPRRVRFKPGWLPMESNDNWTEDGWYHRLGNIGDDGSGSIPYLIECFYAAPDYQLVMMYPSEILEETTWGEYEVTKILNHNPYWGDDNYVLLFSPGYGYMIRVGGSMDMETMEHIARELEVQITDEEIVYDPDFNIGIVNVGRG